MRDDADSRLGPLVKGRLALRIWMSYARVKVGLRRETLPALVARLGSVDAAGPGFAPSRLAHAVDRALRLGERRPTCLVSALVLFRLLREQGDPAELVIGLPSDAENERAHAWVEVGQLDAGPPPGRGRHRPIARYS